jgi:hypothetical protein
LIKLKNNMCKRKSRIGIVVHGPEVIDSGSALRILSYLGNYGEVHAMLGGTMGRLAVIDATLEDIIDISAKRAPSQSIDELSESVDFIVLLNQAKTRESGLVFGAKVANNTRQIKPLFQIDCGGMFVAHFAGEKNWLAEVAASDLCLDYLEWPILFEEFSIEGDTEKRQIFGVLPGEPISINGVVIARAKGGRIEICAQDGKIIAISGAEIKHHGLEKLPQINLGNAIIRSGKIRRTISNPRVKVCRGGEAAIIDHCAEDVFEAAKKAYVVLTVGDDTTIIAGDILSRLGIPIIGIVDGDEDKLLHRPSMSAGSTIINVEQGWDDIIGRQVKETIFRERTRIKMSAFDLENAVIEIAKSRILQIKRL